METLERMRIPQASAAARRPAIVPREGASGATRKAGAAARAAAPVTWWYTLAHAESPLRELALTERDLRGMLQTLRQRGQPLPAELAAPLEGARYIRAFSSLRDALQVARANRRSDYHAYPEPRTLREASLDRLHQRFPLECFPRTTVLLFTGTAVCPDPLLGPDPTPGSLAAELTGALEPEQWDRFTLCGFRQGASVARVTATDRWLRVTPPLLEDAWATSERLLRDSQEAQESGAELADFPCDEAEAKEIIAFRALRYALANEPSVSATRKGAQPAGAKR